VTIQISGRVFEDTGYIGGPGTAFGAGDAALPNVLVELYDGAVLIGSTTTDAAGNYALGGVPSLGTYAVRVVSASLGDGDTPPVAGFNSGFTSAVAEQTYEHDGASGNGGPGALGGNDPMVSDLSTGAGAGAGDTQVTLNVSGANVTGVEFGFTYNLVVNTNDAGQGSLRQFMLNANALAGPNASQLSIPTSDPNFNTLLPSAFVIQPVSALPILTDNAVAIDGTTQEANQGDQRVGLPDIVIDGLNLGTSAYGFHLQASNSTLRQLDVRRFNDGSPGTTGTGILLDGSAGGGDSNTVRDNYLTLNGSTDGLVGAISLTGAADDNLITNNTLTGNFGDGARFTGSANTGNIFTNNTITFNGDDGVTLRGASITFTGNTVSNTGANSCGVELVDVTNSRVANNTITNSGTEGGVCLMSVPSVGNTIGPNNTISGGSGVGIVSQVASSVNNLFTLNVIHSNGSIGIDLNNDGVTANDAGDGDSGSNNLLNFPVIYSAVLDGFGNIVITGEARPGVTIEFFEADGDSSGYGEGQTFVGVAVEGSGADLNTGAGTVDGTAAQFTFTLPAGSLISGDQLTATATDASGNTSEFSLNFVIP
jgi:parallel beta-helix repeat protein